MAHHISKKLQLSIPLSLSKAAKLPITIIREQQSRIQAACRTSSTLTLVSRSIITVNYQAPYLGQRRTNTHTYHKQRQLTPPPPKKNEHKPDTHTKKKSTKQTSNIPAWFMLYYCTRGSTLKSKGYYQETPVRSAELEH